MLKIDKGIPIPKAQTGNHGRYLPRYPFRDMEIGDSFFTTNTCTHNIVTNFTSNYSDLVEKGYRIVTRKVQEDGVYGVRVWRTE